MSKSSDAKEFESLARAALGKPKKKSPVPKADPKAKASGTRGGKSPIPAMPK